MLSQLLDNSITVATTVAENILESKKAAEDEHEKAGQDSMISQIENLKSVKKIRPTFKLYLLVSS